MRTVFLLITFVIFTSYIYPQTYVDGGLHRNISINPDSVFYKFEYPKIPNLMKKMSGGVSKYVLVNILIAAYISVDTNLKVKKIDFYPLIGLGNNLPTIHKLWREIKKNIISASKNWIFKPIKWKQIEVWKKMDDKDSLINKNIKLLEKVKPFGGIQIHFVIFSFNYEFDANDFNFLYLIKVE